MSGVRLETQRLILRPHVTEDFEALANMWADPRVVQYVGGKTFSCEESWSRYLRYCGIWPVLGFGYFAIIDKTTGAFLGEAGLADFHRAIDPPLDGMAEAGWALVPHAWGKGYATEALEAILGWYEALPNAWPVCCIIDPDNSVSIKLAEKTGFRFYLTSIYKESRCLLFIR